MTPAILTALLLMASPADEARREARARFGYGVLLAAREMPARALAEIEVAAKLDPDSLEVQRDRLRLYALFGRDADAMRVAAAILQRDPDDVGTSQSLAKLAHEGRDDATAVRVLTAALARPGLAKPSLRRFGVLRDLATVAAADPVAQELALRGLVAMLTEEVPLLASSPFFDGPQSVAGAAAARREQLADALTARKKFAEAEATYRELQAATGPGRLRWNLAGLELARGRPEEALALLAPLPPTPGREAAFYDRLAQAARQSKPGDARQRLAEAAASRPRTSPVWWVYAEELGRTDPDAAARLFAELAPLTADRDFWDRYVRFLRASRRLGELLDRLDALAGAVAPEGPDGDAVPDAGRTQAAADRLRALVAAAKADPDLPGPLLRAAGDFATRHPVTRDLVVWCAERADRPDAVAEAVRPAAIQGDERAARLYLAALERQRKWQDCLDFLTGMERAGRGDGRHLWRFDRVTPLVELGRGPEALRVLDQLEAMGVLPFELDLSRAAVLTLIGKPRDALAVLARLLAKAPDAKYTRRAKMRQAEAYNALRDFPAADALYEELLDGDPAPGSDRALVLNNYAYNLADAGRRLADAEAMLREAVDLDRAEARRAGRPEDSRGTYLDSLGWALFRRGKLAEAREVFERALNSFDGIGDPIVWDHAGDVYARLGDAAKARAAYARSLELSEGTHQGREHDRRDELKVKLKHLP